MPAALIAVGLVTLLAALLLDGSFWDDAVAVAGLITVVAGLVLVLRRRGYRASRSRLKFEDSQ